MKDFFKSFLASLLALAFFFGLGFFFLMILGAAAGAGGDSKVPANAILVLDLGMNITDGSPDSDPSQALQQLMKGGKIPSLPLATLLRGLERAAQDKNVTGLFLHGNLQSEGYGSGMAALKELREGLEKFKASGKPIHAYNITWSKRDFYLGSTANQVSVHPFGLVDVTGLGAEPMFFGNAFKKYGVEVQVTRVGKYKSAVEPFILDKMSEANREQMSTLLQDLWNNWKKAVAQGRKCEPEKLQALADSRGFLGAEEAKKQGLVDKVQTMDQLLEELKQLSKSKPEDKTFTQMDFVAFAQSPDKAKQGKNRIAVVYAEGTIVDGEGKANEIGGDKLSLRLRKIRQNKDVKAVVLRVNSPGGSAVASELIQREMILLRQAGKPVVVSMGTVAASGGYWISTYSDRIFAEPNTITGSIGVFGLLPNFSKFANSFGITFDRVDTAKLTNPMSIWHTKDAQELARIQDEVDFIYDQFVSKVAESRKLPKEHVQEVAQGRVWSGEAALRLKLVDELGGLQDAVRHAAKLAKIENDYKVDAPGAAKKPFQVILDSFGKNEPKKFTQSPANSIQNRLQQGLDSLKSLNDPRGIYVRMPMDVHVE